MVSVISSIGIPSRTEDPSSFEHQSDSIVKSKPSVSLAHSPLGLCYFIRGDLWSCPRPTSFEAWSPTKNNTKSQGDHTEALTPLVFSDLDEDDTISLDSFSDDESPAEEAISVYMSFSSVKGCLFPNCRKQSAPSRGIPKRPRLGIDIGGVITKKRNDAASKGEIWTSAYESPGAFVAINRLVEIFGAENVFLVSRLTLGGPMQRKTKHWLHNMDFYGRTGVIEDNLRFCSKVDGPDGKGVIAEELGLSHFIDDKIDVLDSVFADPYGNSGDVVREHSGKLLLFAHGGQGFQPPKIPNANLTKDLRQHVQAVANWAQVLGALDPDTSNPAARAAQELLESVKSPQRKKLLLKKRSEDLPAPAGFAGAGMKPTSAKPELTGLDRLAGPVPSQRRKLVLKPRSPTSAA